MAVAAGLMAAAGSLVAQEMAAATAVEVDSLEGPGRFLPAATIESPREVVLVRFLGAGGARPGARTRAASRVSAAGAADGAEAAPSLRPGLAWQRAPGSGTLRTVIELGTVYTVAAINRRYGSAVPRQPAPGGFAETLRAMVSTDRIRLDDNGFTINGLIHPLGGLTYYGLPRANGATATRSALTLAIASVLWEHVIEVREVASINDHIITPMAGWVLGEALFQNRMLFRRGRQDVRNRLLSGLFGLPVNITELVARRPRAQAADLDDAGLPAELSRRFRFYTGLTSSHRKGIGGAWRRGDVGFETELWPAPPTGEATGWMWGTVQTRLDVRFSVQTGGTTELRSFALVMPATWARETARSSGSGARDGRRLALGPAGGFELLVRRLDGQPEHGLAATMLGGLADLRMTGPEGLLQVQLGLFANFAASTAAGMANTPSWRLAVEPTVLRANGYYFGYGLSSLARARLERGRFELAAEMRWHGVRSLPGPNPDVDAGAQGTVKRDSWSFLSVRAGWRLKDWLTATAGMDRLVRLGRLGARSGWMRESGWSLRFETGI